MPLRFIKGNILQIHADIIVNPSDGLVFNKTNVSKSILSAAGKEYEEIISKVAPVSIGDAILTDSGELSYKFVAHVGLPDWCGGMNNEREYIDSCYSEVLYLTDEKKCKSVVFPLFGVGHFGMPYKEAVSIAIRAIEAYLTIKDNLNVFVSLVDEEIYDYIKKQYPTYCMTIDEFETFDAINSLDYKLAHLDYKFIDSLTYYMKRMELTPAQCYNAAGVDKKLFSKIKRLESYQPSKGTIIKFAFALHLSLNETQQLLGTCGLMLSDSLPEDVIIKHYLSQRIYDYVMVQQEINKRSLWKRPFVFCDDIIQKKARE